MTAREHENTESTTAEEELSDYERGKQDGIESALKDARRHITAHLTTAEKWRYDRVVRDFGIMLGEIDESVLETWDAADDIRHKKIKPENLIQGDVYASYNPKTNRFISDVKLFEGTLTQEEMDTPDAEYFLRWNNDEEWLRARANDRESASKEEGAR